MTSNLLYPAPLVETVAALRDGQLDLHRHIDAVCDRIDLVDPVIEALLAEPDRRGRLHRAASALAAAYPEPAGRPPLYGALLAVKDIFHVDGFMTRAGSTVPPELFAGPQAACVTQLRQAGALVLGKAVTTEFAYFEPGPTRNPHALGHTPGGSSSGSAAAVAAGLAPLALGTQTIGSVIRPAAFCGVVGFKPSLGRVDPSGLVFFSRTLDQVGLFTQDVAGMALAAAVVCREWRDLPAPARLPILGIPVGPYLDQAEPAALRAFWQQMGRLAAAGVTVWEVPALAGIEALNSLHRRLVFAEFAQEHAEIYARHAALYRPRTAEIVEIGKSVSTGELLALRDNILALRRELEGLMDAAGIDLWACPAARGPAPEGLHATGDPTMNLPWTHAGLPSVTLPAGRAEAGLPLGLQLVAAFDCDEQLLGWAQQLSALGALAGGDG
jgi:Asp-tRNA(Asn)/Glu-tRNA(Gln) amidotransferase A subunit family amidase